MVTLLDSTSTLQQAIELTFLRLQVTVATNVILADEDVGHAALAGDFLEGILKGCAVLCINSQFTSIDCQFIA
jgi:hypothetical protein